MTPRSDIVHDSATWQRIILGIHIKECHFLNASTSRILLDSAHIQDTKTSSVVRLVSKTVVDVLVVIDTLDFRLVETRVDRLLQVGDVEDVAHRELISRRTGAFFLVDLVIQDQAGLPHWIVDPALVRIGCSNVRRAGDDLCGLRTGFVGYVVDGQGVFIVAVANVLAVVASVGTAVDDALGVVDVAVLRSATFGVGLGWIVEVNEDETSTASRGPGCSSNSYSIVELLVDNNVVAATGRKVGEQASEVCLWVKGLRLKRVDSQELAKIKDLNVVVDGLGADNQVVAVDLDFSPDDGG